MASSRGKNYTSGELKQLCLSVLHISQDSVVGVGQKSQTFWERVMDHYEKSKPKGSEFKGRKSLESKWVDVRHDTTKFMGVYSQVEDMQIFGTNKADTMEKAKELFRINHPKGKSFAYEDCWAILKDCPKFAMPRDELQKRKKAKMSIGLKEHTFTLPLEKENGNPNVFDQDEDYSGMGNTMVVESGAETIHPMGTRKAKEKLKRAKVETTMKMSTNGQLELAVVGRVKVKVMQENSLLQLLSLPCESMEPEFRSFMLEWKMEEAKKLRGRMQEYNQQPRAPPQTLRVSLESSQLDVEIRSRTGPYAERNPLTILNDDEVGTTLETTTPPETNVNVDSLTDEAPGVYGYGTGALSD